MLTNEEKRVAVYTKRKRPTEPHKVLPNTPLEQLNLNWSEKELPERKRTKHVHRLHPYLGKFIPQLFGFNVMDILGRGVGEKFNPEIKPIFEHINRYRPIQYRRPYYFRQRTT